MVRIGQAAIPAIGFRSSGPISGVGVEAGDLSTLYQRAGTELLSRPHRIDFHQVVVVLRGVGVHVVDFVEHPCAPRTLLWVRPGQAQLYSSRRTMEGHVVLFTPEFLPSRAEFSETLTGLGAPTRWELSAEDYVEVDDCVRLLMTETQRSVTSPARLRHLIAALVLHVQRLPRPDGQDFTAGGEIFAGFRRELEVQYRRTRNASSYANSLGCSAKTLSRACQAATGRTAKDLIDDRVILEAKRLLAHTDQPTDAIGRQLGFREATNFGKFFARHVGVTPGTFRRQFLGE